MSRLSRCLLAIVASATQLASPAITWAQRTASVPPPRILDEFETKAGWGMFPSDGVKLSLVTSQGWEGKALTLAYDFGGKAGYAIARKSFAIGTPTGNWSFSFRARGRMRPNTLEFKLLDKSGENVWWYTIPEYQPTGEFQTVTIRQRQVNFAWGPIGGGPPRDIAAIEFVVTAGSGGNGTLTIDDFVFTPLPADVPVGRIDDISASYTLPGSTPLAAIDNDSNTVWRAKSSRGNSRTGATLDPSEVAEQPILVMDFGGVRTYGGLILHWVQNEQPDYVMVDSSNDGVHWAEADRLSYPRDVRSYLPIPDGSSRYLRIRLTGAEDKTKQYGLRDVSVRPLDFAPTATKLLEAVARGSNRGLYPRSLRDEQIYWSVVGVSGGKSEALLSEDGQLELAKRGPSLEPFLYVGNKLMSWASVTPTQSLLDDVRPIPSVTWKSDNASLIVTAFAAGTRTNSSIYGRYRIINHGSSPLAGTFSLALRPIQVNPPWQFLNTPGGAGRIDSIFWARNILRANALRIRPLTKGAAVGTAEFDAGEASSWIKDGMVPPRLETWDARGLASAVMAWKVNIAPGDSTDIVVASRLDGTGDPLHVAPGTAAAVRAATNTRLNQVARTWARDQDAVTIKLPKAAPPIVEAIKANLAWILINRDGPGIQPGSRSYERSWIRDGALTAEALLRLGRATEAKQFAEWYAPFQYPSGKVPCCVDSRGADPVDEHDSHGELIHLIYEVYKYTGDRAFVTRMWPHVKRATVFMDSLRRTHLTAAYNTDSLRAFRGLLPASISHEGYSAKPMHSVWDDGFALLGYREAWELANTLGRRADVAAIGKSLRAFSEDFNTALNGAMERNKINFIPGSIELADFDATSTTTLLSPGNATGMSAEHLRATFDRYFASSRNRARPDSLWENYTPYEWRTVGALLRLGKRSEAVEMLDHFMRDRRPANWQQWAEVVWREPRNPKFIGDMPHTWVGSDFIRSALDVFAYANPCAGPKIEVQSAAPYSPTPCQLMIGMGIDGKWLANGDSIVVHGLRTGGETVGYTLVRKDNAVTFRFDRAVRRSEMLVVAPIGMQTLRAGVDGAERSMYPEGAVTVRGTTREVTFILR